MLRTPRSNCWVVAAGLAMLVGPAPYVFSAADDKPTLSLRANPTVAFAPAKVSLTADLKGGSNDAEEFYCTTIEWDWGDETRSESTPDCEPYEAGKSEIRRRFTNQRVFDTQGTYRVVLRLKKKDKVMTSASVRVQVRGGVRDFDR